MSAVTNKIARCCVVCDECADCYEFTVDGLYSVLLDIQKALADYGTALSQKMKYGYACICLTEYEATSLTNYKEVIRRFIRNMVQQTVQCLCDVELQKIKEKVIAIVSKFNCCGTEESLIQTDSSNFDQWAASNPGCVAYEVWEKSFDMLSPQFIITGTRHEIVKAKKVLHAFAVKSEKVLSLMTSAQDTSVVSKVEFKAINTSAGKTEWKILIKKHKCDLSLKAYMKAVECNLSFKAIASIYECGGSLIESKEGVQIKIGVKKADLCTVISVSSIKTELDNLNDCL